MALLYVCVSLLLLPLAHGASVVYVDPIADNCGDFNCTRDAAALLPQNQTLDEALAALSSQTVLRLRPGCHCVQSFNFVSNVTDVTLVGEASREKVNITCAQGLGLAFYSVVDISLQNVTVDGCGLTGANLSTFRHTMESVVDLFFHIHSDYTIAVMCGNCTDVRIKDITVTNTKGLGLLGVNVMGTSEVTDCTFSLNAPSVSIIPVGGSFNITNEDFAGGGALFLYHDYLDGATFHESISQLSFESSVFSGNIYPGFSVVVGLYFQYSESVRDIGYVLGGGGGLSIIMTQLRYAVSTLVENCTFRENKARYGGGAHVEIFTGVTNSNITFSNCLFEENGEHVTDVGNILDTTSGAGLAFFKDFVQPSLGETPEIISSLPDNLVVTHTTFRGNEAFTGAAMIVMSRYSTCVATDSGTVLLDSCTFEDNGAYVGTALYINEQKESGTQPGLYYMMDNTTIKGNKVYVNDSLQAQSVNLADSSSIIEGTSINITFKDSSFIDNSGTVVRASLSVVHLEGTVTFANNIGTFGGALRLLSSTLLIVRNNSNVTFLNNTAEIEGGAIFAYYVNSLPNVAYYDCFLFFGRLDLFCLGNINCVNISKTRARLNFINNTAPLGGVIYGSTLETCPWGTEIRFAGNYTDMTLLEILDKDYHNIFNFDEVPNTIQQVSTDSSKVEVVTNSPGPVNITPGEEFHVKVMTFDRFQRVKPSILSSKVGGGYRNGYSSVGLSGYWFTDGDSDMPVTVYGDGNMDNVTVTVFTLDSFAQTNIAVNLLSCSDGFKFQNRSCICDPEVTKSNYVTCNSTSKELTVDNGYWIGYGPNGELALSHCLQDYCESGSVTFHPPNFNSQCHVGYKRSGIACGECNEGFSTVFGTNKCRKCNYRGLYWIPVLGFLGLAIIGLICYFRVSISQGYLLSILFYVNVVSLFAAFFSAGQSDSVGGLFLLTSWLNLELGIVSCFYDGMDAVARTGLQFVFPTYLYLLMFIIILIARRSHRFSAIFSRGGFSGAKLFATLLLMTHTSITKTCVEILGIAIVWSFSGGYEFRWKTDPNVPYFSPARIPLVIISILLLLFFIIPAPFVLIFPNIVRKIKVLQKLTPIYDAFWAPFKPRFRFWIGLRLLLRGIPLCLAFFVDHPSNVAWLGFFLVILTYAQVMVWPFKTTALNAVDLFLQYNMLTLVMVSLYFTIYLNEESGEMVSRFYHLQLGAFALIVFTAYLVVLGIFLWHAFIRFPKLKGYLQKFGQKLLTKVYPRRKSTMGSINISFSHGSPGQSYGSTGNGRGAEVEDTRTDLMDSDEESNSGIKVVQFSELREPLLEEGELSIEDVTPNRCN